jgi:YD repeat-containing protein
MPGSLTASVTTFAYDVFDRVTQKTDPESGVTVTTYDDAGNVLSIKDPVNNTTSFAYDGMGRVTIETNQLSDTRSFQYAAPGNLARRTDRNGRVIHYTHDNLERLTKERWYQSATPTPTLSVSTTTEGGERNEEQYVGFTSMVWGGTFTLTVNSQTTSSISYSATAAQVQTALEALSSIDSGDVAVTKETSQSSTKWNILFQGALSGTDIAQSTINTSGLSGYGFSAIQGTDPWCSTTPTVSTTRPTPSPPRCRPGR